MGVILTEFDLFLGFNLKGIPEYHNRINFEKRNLVCP